MAIVSVPPFKWQIWASSPDLLVQVSAQVAGSVASGWTLRGGADSELEAKNQVQLAVSLLRGSVRYAALADALNGEVIWTYGKPTIDVPVEWQKPRSGRSYLWLAATAAGVVLAVVLWPVVKRRR